jgi:hypothetical protein
MIPFKIHLWNVVAVDELEAIALYQRFKGDIKFYATDYRIHHPEDKAMFSRAISKFQHLVIFEE